LGLIQLFWNLCKGTSCPIHGAKSPVTRPFAPLGLAAPMLPGELPFIRISSILFLGKIIIGGRNIPSALMTHTVVSSNQAASLATCYFAYLSFTFRCYNFGRAVNICDATFVHIPNLSGLIFVFGKLFPINVEKLIYLCFIKSNNSC
jgi:hypothetical protein